MAHKAMVTVLAVCAATGLVWAGSTKIVVEGEDYYSIKPSMEKVMDEEASGGAYIRIPRLHRRPGATDVVPTDDGHATFKIKVPVSGTYYLYALCNWALWDGNSFFVSVDDGDPKVFGQDGTYNKRHWVPLGARNRFRYQLSAGEHVIRFQNREDGARLDQFLLTDNMRYKPVSKETRTPQYIIKP